MNTTTTPTPERAAEYRARLAEQPGGLIVAAFHGSDLEGVETEGRHYLAMYGEGHALSVEHKIGKRWKPLHFYVARAAQAPSS